MFFEIFLNNKDTFVNWIKDFQVINFVNGGSNCPIQVINLGFVNGNKLGVPNLPFRYHFQPSCAVDESTSDFDYY